MEKTKEYTIPAATRIGHVHLKVSNLQKSLDFYVGLLGFEITQRYGTDAVFISAGGYHHHIGLNTWHSKNAPPAPKNSVGLYHTAILYPTRKDLAIIFDRLCLYTILVPSYHAVSRSRPELLQLLTAIAL